MVITNPSFFLSAPEIMPLAVCACHDVASTISANGLYKTEVIRRRASWRTVDEVEIETLKWVDWFNHRRLLETIGNIPPAEAEEAFYANLTTLDMVA